MTNNLAVIDLGSNSVRLKISELTKDGQAVTKHYEKRYVRLSSQMGPEKILKAEPMDRTVAALRDFRQVCDEYDHGRIVAVATAAVRQAKNQQEFLDRVQRETGFKFRVITGEQEAYLDYVGVARTLPIDRGIIIDTGGASMELIAVDNGAAEETVSIPIGSVTLSQRYQLGDVIKAADLFDAMVEVDEILSHQRWLNRFRDTRIVALGGSNRALGKIYRWRNAVDGKAAPIHGLTMSSQTAFGIMHQLVEADQATRAQMRGVMKARADVIVGGLLPLLALMRQLAIDSVSFSNNGLREGILFKYVEHAFDMDNLETL
ncbi:Ppx/GppA family phosphatase [Limosilactobacillus kribbianus]|uniref:Ppx/GppA family phosphatase n=1 Tax=Limosilactobacillus kribbianus TaxID=2982695 RepID=UPI002263D436|nr:Ppx/GppA family phosphatase [Limosilactobacillus kribbianus]